MSYINNENFREIFEQFYKQIYNYIYFRIGFIKEIAEDITQDIFVKIWKTKDSFDPELGTMKSWIFQITRNHLIDFYRKNKHKQHSIESLPEEILITEDNIETRILIEQIVKKMNLLKDNEREILILRYINGLELKEIAELINKNYDYTKVLINRALNELKEIVNEGN